MDGGLSLGLLGAAATEGTLASGAMTASGIGLSSGALAAPATAGLFGTGGAFSFGTTMSTLATAGSVIGSVGSMAMGVMQGANQAAYYEDQARFQQQQFELQQQSIATQASQDEVIRRRQLAGILSSQASIAAAHGVDIGSSASFDSIEQGSIANAEADISANNTTAQNRTLMSSLQASQSAMASAFKAAQGYGEIAGSVFSGGVDLAKSGVLQKIATKLDDSNLTK